MAPLLGPFLADLLNISERCGAIDLRFALAKSIEIGSIEYQYRLAHSPVLFECTLRRIALTRLGPVAE